MRKPGPKTGSAFAVHSSGKLLTNDHVVEGCSVVTVSSQGGNPVTGRIQARDVRNDLALIALNSPLFINCKFSEDADKVW